MSVRYTGDIMLAVDVQKKGTRTTLWYSWIYASAERVFGETSEDP